MFQFEQLVPSFIWVLINLLILFFILRKILFKPVTKYMQNRTNSIRESLENAENQKAEAAELKRKYEEQIRGAKDEGDRILEDARAKAEREHDRLVGDARKEAESVLALAREEIDREREQMLKEVRGQVAGLALAAASRVIEANMDTESNRALVDRFIDEAGAA